MIEPILWIISVELIGLLGIPIGLKLFKNLPDVGYTLSKTLGLLLITYLFWMIGLTDVASASVNILIVISFITIVSVIIFSKHAHFIVLQYKKNWQIILAGELIFLALFAFWVIIMSGDPSIDHTEKPMDFAFLNSLVASDNFPPEDPWLSGMPISYYYFGHMIMAVITKLTAVPSYISYNLSIALIAALSGLTIFGLLCNLVRAAGRSTRYAIAIGSVGVLTLTIFSNFEGVIELAHHMGWGNASFWEWLGIKGLSVPLDQGIGLFPDTQWWWWRATRIIDVIANGVSLDYTITEFPFFSFILGDLHSHMMAIPFVIMCLSVSFGLFLEKKPLNWLWLKQNPDTILLIAVVFGSLGFINSWDLPISTSILVLAVMVHILRSAHSGDRLPFIFPNALILLVLMIPLSLILYAPFYFHLNTHITGIAPLLSFGSRISLFLISVGLPFFLTASFIIVCCKPHIRTWTSLSRNAYLVVSISIIPPIVWLFFLIVGSSAAVEFNIFRLASERLLLTAPLLALGGAALFLAMKTQIKAASSFTLIIGSTAMYLLAGSELFYVEDLFGNRMNTVFKFHYHSWILLSISGSYGIFYIFTKTQKQQLINRLRLYTWATLCIVFTLMSLYYPLGTIIGQLTNHNSHQNTIRGTLNGIKFVEQNHEGEYKAIMWLRDHAPKGRITEAVGPDYSNFGRISAFTGLPTIVGWVGHEQQWRKNTEEITQRTEDLEIIYTSTDGQEVKNVLNKYGIKYIYSGDRERKSYGQNKLSNFEQFLNVVYSEQQVIIYEYLPKK